MPDLSPWISQVDRICADLLSSLLDYYPDQDEDWDDVVEQSMNDAWDLLRKVDPDA